MPNTRITTVHEMCVPIGAKEALNFCLGCEGFVGRPIIVPKNVESDRKGIIGQIQPGDNHFRI